MRAHAKRRKKVDLSKIAFTRFMFVIAFLILWIAGIGARLVYLQVNMHEELRGKAVSQRRDVKKQRQLRGTIYDRNERSEAVNEEREIGHQRTVASAGKRREATASSS